MLPSSPAESNSQERWFPQLDGIRAIAVNLVFIHHWTLNHLGLGLVGVQLFFVLSGFLITRILLRERSEVDHGRQSVAFSVRRFYIRRFLRIFPLYCFCLFVCLALGRFGIRQTFLWHFFYLSNILFFLKDSFYVPFAHFWTLSVEEQFYLFWPWVVLWVPIRRLVPVLLFLIFLAPLTRVLFYLSGHVDFVQTSTLVLANLDTLGLGALLAYIMSAPEAIKQKATRFLTWAVPFCLLEVILSRQTPLGVLGVWLDPTAVALASVWAVWNASHGFGGLLGRLLSHPVMLYLGRISYGLYVWHMFAPAVLRNVLKAFDLPATWNDGVVGYFLLYAWTVSVASVTWFLFEKPINALKQHFQYSKPALVLSY